MDDELTARRERKSVNNKIEVLAAEYGSALDECDWRKQLPMPLTALRSLQLTLASSPDTAPHAEVIDVALQSLAHALRDAGVTINFD